ncbi:hypothetical protein [Allohahella sp. A8]|uniref:hypothetical protein n=1 Tax=Allohahella sp. A8 TaxID=3141461 RepID=UPI003A8032A2
MQATLRVLKYAACFGIVWAILTYVGPTGYEDAKRDEAYNCKHFPTAFSYCADVLARAGK